MNTMEDRCQEAKDKPETSGFSGNNGGVDKNITNKDTGFMHVYISPSTANMTIDDYFNSLK